MKFTVAPTGPFGKKEVKNCFSFAEIKKHELFQVFVEQLIAKFEQITCLWTFFLYNSSWGYYIGKYIFPFRVTFFSILILKISIYWKQKPFHRLFPYGFVGWGLKSLALWLKSLLAEALCLITAILAKPNCSSSSINPYGINFTEVPFSSCSCSVHCVSALCHYLYCDMSSEFHPRIRARQIWCCITSEGTTGWNQIIRLYQNNASLCHCRCSICLFKHGECQIKSRGTMRLLLVCSKQCSEKCPQGWQRGLLKSFAHTAAFSHF